MNFSFLHKLLFSIFSGCLLLMSASFSSASADAPEEPVGIVLTWQYDPTTTMTIDWHVTPDDEAVTTLITSRLNPLNGKRPVHSGISTRI